MANQLSRENLENLARRYARKFTEPVSKRIWEGGGKNPAYVKAVEEGPSIMAKIPQNQREEFKQIVEVLKKKQGIGRGSGSKALMIPQKAD